MGIAGMILGILAVVFAFIPVIGAFVAIPCAVVGLPLSSVGFYRNRQAGTGTGMSIAGIATCTVGLILAIVWLIVFGIAVSES